MTEHTATEVWGQAVQDAALLGLKLELDGLMAMFQALSLSAQLPKIPPEAPEETFDNLPV